MPKGIGYKGSTGSKRKVRLALAMKNKRSKNKKK